MVVQAFPAAVRSAMLASGASVTCVPVRLERDEWESALFFHLAGPECKQDRQRLAKARRPLPVSLEADVLTLPQAAVVIIRPEVFTAPDDPLASEILLTPGGSDVHFEALELLCRQSRLSWFFADGDFRLLHSQQSPLEAAQRESFDDLLRDAVRHDALIRASARYDAGAALAEVVRHYELRPGIHRTGSKGSGPERPNNGSSR
jgi:hypothetical protein